MRIALILLSILAMMFIGSVTWSLMSQEWWWNLKKISPTSEAPVDNITLETWKNQIKTEEKIEKLSAMVEELARKNGVQTTSTENNTNTKPEETKPKLEAVKISGKILSLLMPTVSPTLTENNGILGLFIFDQSIGYSTYKDEKQGLTIIPMNIPYDVFLRNIQALGGKPYSVNESKTFPAFRSFYLNPEKTDTFVRIALESETQTVLLEIPKTKFPTYKDLLLGKTPSKK